MPKKEVVVPNCPPQVLELVDSLQASGTGKAKCQALKELGAKCSGSSDFLEGAKKLVGEGTLKKILAFIGGMEVPRVETITLPGPCEIGADGEMVKPPETALGGSGAAPSPPVEDSPTVAPPSPPKGQKHSPRK